ncbi:MAG TPA: glycoside hydrolase family 97 protein [Terriglobia bacterium]|nr:glycoside hydrolase family 97 protein [Terriglobia bacterium]
MRTFRQIIRRARVLVLATIYTLVAGPWSWPNWASARNALGEEDTGHSLVVQSPDGNIRIAFGLYEKTGKKAVPCFDVSFRGKMLIHQGSLGIDLADGGPLNSHFKIVQIALGQSDKTYAVYPGKSSTARNHYREALVSLKEQSVPHRRLGLIFRAYNDGAAFRYRFPIQSGFTDFTITDELSTFSFMGNPQAYALPLGTFTTSYEKYYQLIPLKDISFDALLGLPLLLEYPNKMWVAVTEANLTNYAGMYLSGVAGQPGVLVSRLSPWPDNPQVKVKARLPHLSPWRVLMIADDPGRLIESNLILNLNEPCAFADISWIRPGKTTFPWWNGYEVGDAGFRGELNTQTMKHYIDFCAEQGIEYHTLDGFDRAWYGGPIVPYQGADITKSVPEIDLPEVLSYARQKGVGLRLWMHWQAAKADMETAFPIYERWGIQGVMLDFMDRDDQEMVNFLCEAIRLAAQHHLTVTLHGVSKPTGLCRTYPNLLTTEAVLNLEYDKWDALGVPPEHEVIVPFIRMLAGPLDFHQGSFHHVLLQDYKPRNIAPMVKGTRARTLASYVVFENHLPMMADYPAAYRGQPGLQFLRQVPTTWDETRVLNGAVGKYITIARRSRKDWYVGSMTDSNPRELTIPLDFIGPGKFVADVYADDLDSPDQPSKLTIRRLHVSSGDTLRAALAPAGGHVIRLTPVQ